MRKKSKDKQETLTPLDINSSINMESKSHPKETIEPHMPNEIPLEEDSVEANEDLDINMNIVEDEYLMMNRGIHS